MDDAPAGQADDDDRSLYERAPCGYLSMTPDGLIVRVNQTFLDWTGHERSELVAKRRFADLLTAGGRIYHETHYAPMLRLHGSAREIALEIVCADATRLSVLVNSVVQHDESGKPAVIRVAVFGATDRRRYERELLAAKQRSEASERRAMLLARTLQQTLIPPQLPDVQGLDLGAVYQPAGSGNEIGGDFYDVFQVGPSQWVVALGDVQGKGVEAAILTALVRYSIRAAAVEHDSPAAVLHVLNQVLLRDDTDRLCTAVIIFLQRRDPLWVLTLSVGGHPRPFARLAGQRPTRVGREGSLLGFFQTGVFHDSTLILEPGDAVMAFTDGVSEARRGQHFFGEQPIIAALQEHCDASAVARALLASTLEFQQGPSRDDIAIVAIQNPD